MKCFKLCPFYTFERCTIEHKFEWQIDRCPMAQAAHAVKEKKKEKEGDAVGLRERSEAETA